MELLYVFVYTCVCISVRLRNVFNPVSWGDKIGNFLAPSFPLPLLLLIIQNEKITGVLESEALLWTDT